VLVAGRYHRTEQAFYVMVSLPCRVNCPSSTIELKQTHLSLFEFFNPRSFFSFSFLPRVERSFCQFVSLLVKVQSAVLIKVGDYHFTVFSCHVKSPHPVSMLASSSISANKPHEPEFRWNEKAGPSAGRDTLPMRNALEVQLKGDRP
jgi:hypothetical protein